MSYYKDDDFEKWLQINGDIQARQSRGYIDSIINNILCYYGLEGIFTSLASAIKEKDKAIDKLRDLYSKLNKAATLKIHYPNSNVLAKFIKAPESVSQWCTILKKYIDFLEQTEPSKQKYLYWGAKNWNSALVDFWKETISAVAVDGYTSLLNAGAIGSYDRFVKLAVESSYFLNATAINNYHKELLDKINNGGTVPARKSTDSTIQYINNKKQLVFVSGNIIIPIEQDKDGNKAVRDLIEETTGYSVSSGYDCFFTNFKISHIWGHAYDPRMFTSLWNIVIVPAWANDLLDKTNANNDLALKMINTFKAICEKIYAAPSKGSKLGLNKNEITPYNPNYVVCGDYNLNIIGNKNNSPIASISKKLVTI